MKISELNKSQQKAIKNALRFATKSWLNEGKILEISIEYLNKKISKMLTMSFQTSCFKNERKDTYRFTHFHHIFIGSHGGVSAYEDGIKVKGLTRSLIVYSF